MQINRWWLWVRRVRVYHHKQHSLSFSGLSLPWALLLSSYEYHTFSSYILSFSLSLSLRLILSQNLKFLPTAYTIWLFDNVHVYICSDILWNVYVFEVRSRKKNLVAHQKPTEQTYTHTQASERRKIPEYSYIIYFIYIFSFTFEDEKIKLLLMYVWWKFIRFHTCTWVIYT